MNTPFLRLAPVFLAAVFALLDSASAQGAYVLLHSILDPGTNVQAHAQQGWSVAVDGNIAVIGAPYDDTGLGDSGVVNVYDATTGALLHTLTNPSPASSDWFGISVAISGTRVVVGTPLDDSGAFRSGSAYVYDLGSASPITPILMLTNPGPAATDYFGNSVAISGTRVVVGAYPDDTVATDAGSAYVFDLASATPTVPVLTLTNPSPEGMDYFGSAVAISDTRVVVGAYQDDTGALNAGSAYVYDLASATPALPVVALTNPSLASYDYFGYSVAISGTRVVVGANEDDTGAVNSGSAYVFDLVSATPTVPVTTLTNPGPAQSDYFGFSVAISGTRVVVGANADNTGAADTGSAYVFDIASATPTVPVTTLTNPSPGRIDFFGYSVAITGTRVVVGAPLDDTGATNAGSAYVFDLTDASPAIPATRLANATPAILDTFGWSVALSGTRMVVGAPADDTGAFEAGVAYVYDFAGATPTLPMLTLTNPSPAANDAFGQSVAISGHRVVVGAPGDNTGAGDAGSAYVYDLTSATPTVPMLMLTNPFPEGGDVFGSPLTIAGTRVVVGVPYDNAGAVHSGSAYVFDLASATPAVPVTTLTNPSPAFQDFFGISVAIAGTRVVVGSHGEDAGAIDAGIAYIYDLFSATPAVPVTTLNNPSPAGGDLFGYSVAIAGTLVAVGAPREDVRTTDTGSAYVFDLATATPTVPVATLTKPSPIAYDNFGSSVAISGAWVVVGALGDNAVVFLAGGAYVFDLTSTAPTVPVATLNNPTPGATDRFSGSLAIDGTMVVIGAPYDDSPFANTGAAYIFAIRPPLKIVPAGPGSATLSWSPATSSGFVLQCADSLATAGWTNAPSGALNPVTIATTNAAKFYRLVQP